MGKSTELGMLVCSTETKAYSYRNQWTIPRWLEERRICVPLWKKLMKLVDLEEPASFLDHVYLGCTPRECSSNDKITEEHKRCSKHEFPLEQRKNTWAEETQAKTAFWSYDMKKCGKMRGRTL